MTVSFALAIVTGNDDVGLEVVLEVAERARSEVLERTHDRYVVGGRVVDRFGDGSGFGRIVVKAARVTRHLDRRTDEYGVLVEDGCDRLDRLRRVFGRDADDDDFGGIGGRLVTIAGDVGRTPVSFSDE